jgi:uncharacterized membrane protein
MATLSVLKFDNPGGADQALSILQGLQKQQLIEVQDAAVVTWPTDRKAPKTKQAFSTAGYGALAGSFWGFLFGLLFFIPLMGLAIGAAVGAISGALSDYGIDDDFIKAAQDKIVPGTSALFLMTGKTVLDKVIPELQTLNPELITTNLSDEQETKLREMFAHHEGTDKAEGKTTA